MANRRKCLLAIGLVFVLVANPFQPVAAADDCTGLPAFETQLFAIGQQWLDDTEQAGVSYTADPLHLDAAHWSAFSELAAEKRDNLRDIDPPIWLDAWLDVQITSADVQSKAGAAVARDGLDALMQFGDDFIRLLARNLETTLAATDRCAAFDAVSLEWQAMNRDFEPESATPVAA